MSWSLAQPTLVSEHWSDAAYAGSSGGLVSVDVNVGAAVGLPVRLRPECGVLDEKPDICDAPSPENEPRWVSSL
jgi:hypothetical protein